MSDVRASLLRADAIVPLREPGQTDAGASNSGHVHFRRVHACRRVTHEIPRDTAHRRGIDSRLFPHSVLAVGRLRHGNGVDPGQHLD
jgi:hypothetical protein